MDSDGKRAWEWVRNILLIVICLGAVAYFYSRSSIMPQADFNWSGHGVLEFSGDLSRSDYSRQELAGIKGLMERHSGLLTRLTIQVTRQDDYGKLTETTEVLYRMRAGLNDGTTVDLPVRRVARGKLVPTLLANLERALEPLAYKARMPRSKTGPKVVNTP